MASRTYGVNPLLAYISNIGGCIIVMRIMQLLVRESEAFLVEMGRRSMAIYILHPLVQIIITDILLSTIVEGDYGTIFYVWQAGCQLLFWASCFPYMCPVIGRRNLFCVIWDSKGGGIRELLCDVV